MKDGSGRVVRILRVGGSLLFAVMILAAGVASALQIREALKREREFQAASACAAAPMRESGCLWRQEFTVGGVDKRVTRTRSPKAELVTPSGELWKVSFSDTGPVLSRLEPGAKVVGVIWHGQVVEVVNGDMRQQTLDGPVGWPADRVGGALALIPAGLAGLAGGLWSLFPGVEPRRRRVSVIMQAHGFVLGAAGFVAIMVQHLAGWPVWAIPAVWGPLAFAVLASMVAFVRAVLRGDLDDDFFALPQMPTPSAN